MKTHQSAITLFTQLSYEEKKQRVLVLCEILQAHSKYIQKILPSLTNNEIDEIDMIAIYEKIVASIENIETEKLHHAIQKIETTYKKIQDIRKQEQEDLEKENIEDLLHTI